MRLRAATPMWLAALTGWLAHLTPRLRRSGDMTSETQPRWTLFENLQQVLRLAAECPAGRSGDAIRRGACELTEASSIRQDRVHRQRLLKTIARIQSRHAQGGCGDSDPSPVLLKDLTDALCQQLRDQENSARVTSRATLSLPF